jgi:DNA-binding NarL/FixJ family response regulator
MNVYRPLMKKIKMLIIEDDKGVRDGLVHILSKAYELECAEND